MFKKILILKLNEGQIDSLASAIYTQIGALQPDRKTTEVKIEIKNLKAILKKLGRSL